MQTHVQLRRQDAHASCHPLLQRIVKLDPDIKQVSADALKTIALATVGFQSFLWLGFLNSLMAAFGRLSRLSLQLFDGCLSNLQMATFESCTNCL
jgi:hypothetical protein